MAARKKREINVRFSCRLTGLATVAASLFVMAIPVTASAAEAHPRPTDYYLSLGDSLSIGIQPGPDGVQHPTSQGYDHDLYAKLKLQEAREGRNLKLVELGCSGETTTTMIKGGVCTYPNGESQLEAAEHFLSKHRGHVKLVTISIGANDLGPCATSTGINATCVEKGLAELEADLPTITAKLKDADPCPETTFAGINLYDPFLASWLQGSAGEEIAKQSVTVVGDVNSILQADYSSAGYKVADVATAFNITEFTPTVPLPGVGQVPLNVATTCELTWMCAPAPVGPNIHANAAGYATIAGALESVLAVAKH
jgi:lysophospholipase L1-like esterase